MLVSTDAFTRHSASVSEAESSSNVITLVCPCDEIGGMVGRKWTAIQHDNVQHTTETYRVEFHRKFKCFVLSLNNLREKSVWNSYIYILEIGMG